LRWTQTPPRDTDIKDPQVRLFVSLDHLSEFQADLQALDADAIYQKYVACDECRGDLDFDVDFARSVIAKQFDVEVEAIKLVGSAKLGFTLVNKVRRIIEAGRSDGSEPKIESRPRFSAFTVNSDVDIAIVSASLFDSIWKQCFDFWSLSDFADEINWRKGRHFRDYFFRGWMRPDKLPTGQAFPFSNEWFDFFREKTSERLAGDFALKAGVYRDEDFLRNYQTIAIKRCAFETKATP
jgi:hypothetical protein